MSKKGVAKNGLGVHITCFDVKIGGIAKKNAETVKIMRIGDNFAWLWVDKDTGNQYGDYVVVKEYVERKIERRLMKLKSAGDTEGFKEVEEFYRKLKIQDAENILDTLTQQAEKSIELIKSNREIR